MLLLLWLWNKFHGLLSWNDTDDGHSPNITWLLSQLSLNKIQPLVAPDFSIDPATDIEFTIEHHGCTLYLYQLPILYADIQYLVECNYINTANYDCDNGIIEFTIVYHGFALYLYVVPILYYNIQYLIGCENINTTICDKNNSCHAAGLFCLPIVMEKKIVNTSTIDVDDNNFSFDNYHDPDLAFDLDHDTARDNKQIPTY